MSPHQTILYSAKQTDAVPTYCISYIRYLSYRYSLASSISSTLLTASHCVYDHRAYQGVLCAAAQVQSATCDAPIMPDPAVPAAAPIGAFATAAAQFMPSAEMQQKQQQQQHVELSEDAATVDLAKSLAAVVDIALEQQQQQQQHTGMPDPGAEAAAAEKLTAAFAAAADCVIAVQSSSDEQSAKQMAAATVQSTTALTEQTAEIERETAVIQAETARLQELLPAAQAKFTAVIAAAVADVAAARARSEAQTRVLRKTLQILRSATEQRRAVAVSVALLLVFDRLLRSAAAVRARNARSPLQSLIVICVKCLLVLTMCLVMLVILVLLCYVCWLGLSWACAAILQAVRRAAYAKEHAVWACKLNDIEEKIEKRSKEVAAKKQTVANARELYWLLLVQKVRETMLLQQLQQQQQQQRQRAFTM
jgi:hypothetical protein